MAEWILKNSDTIYKPGGFSGDGGGADSSLSSQQEQEEERES